MSYAPDARDLLAYNDPTASSTSMKMSASAVGLYNPNTGASHEYPFGSNLTDLTCSITSTGAGGRDASAFLAFDNVWFYFIGGPGEALATLCSRTAPLGTNTNGALGPILPAGYTAYAPAFPVVISYNANLIHNSHRSDEGLRTVKLASTSGNVVATDPEGLNFIGRSLISGADIPQETYIVSQQSGPPNGLGAYLLNRFVGTVAATGMFFAPPYPAQFIVRNRDVWFSNPILLALSDHLRRPAPVPTAAEPWQLYAWDYRLWIPEDAKFLDAELDPEVASSAANFLTAALDVGWYDTALPNAAMDLNLSTYAYFGIDKPLAQNVVARFPVVSHALATKLSNGDSVAAAQRCGHLYFKWIIGSGPTNGTPQFVLFLRGYSF